MLKLRAAYNDKSRTQAQPALYGATLNVRPATPADLPPGCVWIDKPNIESAAESIADHITNGPYSTCIWVPPQTQHYRMARHFFTASAGHLEKWRLNLEEDSSEDILRLFDAAAKRDDLFTASSDVLSSRNYSEDFHNAAWRQVLNYSEAFVRAFNSDEIQIHTQSTRHYEAHRLSYYLHADGGSRKYMGIRALMPWVGANSLLYDSRQLTLMPSLSKDRGFYIFRPHDEEITAWRAPRGALLVITQGHRENHPYYAVHSAAGQSFAGAPTARVLTKIDVRIP